MCLDWTVSEDTYKNPSSDMFKFTNALSCITYIVHILLIITNISVNFFWVNEKTKCNKIRSTVSSSGPNN